MHMQGQPGFGWLCLPSLGLRVSLQKVVGITSHTSKKSNLHSSGKWKWKQHFAIDVRRLQQTEGADPKSPMVRQSKDKK
jgi:hypothetical protein